VSLGWTSIVFNENSFYLDCVGTILYIRANLADKMCTTFLLPFVKCSVCNKPDVKFMNSSNRR